ncbi:polysaccharide deacetylase [Asanoa ferruginea]|uniref:Polysaccharide deacetylase n=1 Tax=Asanoa ferruginea TaxID=53367 RepID=A0A3D9ZUF5_9ACTN|nr:polysaccharide deacetylase family protein [Asanoa ferruginea]REG00842.1 polysaccharide deacetylase [Asanoa ferruginea]GIF47283.1 polysaccharide deacetylase familiy protein [Asanoa ferruginea]
MNRGWRAALAIAATAVAPALAPSLQVVAPALAGVGDRRHVALTFDDGPHPSSTPAFLELLDRLGVRATFFLLGEQAAAYPALARRIVVDGHEVALHGYRHRLLPTRSPSATRDDLHRGYASVATVTGVQPRWYRPPYGVLTPAAQAAAAELGMRPVLWTDWGRDWTARATPGTVYDTVTRRLAGGATVLLHDSDTQSAPGSWRATLGAVTPLAGACDRRGWTIGPLGEHRMA